MQHVVAPPPRRATPAHRHACRTTSLLALAISAGQDARPGGGCRWERSCSDGMSQDSEATRRTQSTRPGGRAADVVDRVVTATVAELSRVGYQAMRVEDVAARSGVNKTTIYRRWPTKAELVSVAVHEQTKRRLPDIDTGSVRGDLLASLRGAFELLPYEQGMLRVVQMERSVAEVDAFARTLREHIRALRVALVRRGIQRGELPTNVDVELIVDLLSAPVHRALLLNETLRPKDIERMIDLVLAGAASVAQKSHRTSRSTVDNSRPKKKLANVERAKPARRAAAGARSTVTTRSAAGTRRSR